MESLRQELLLTAAGKNASIDMEVVGHLVGGINQVFFWGKYDVFTFAVM